MAALTTTLSYLGLNLPEDLPFVSQVNMDDELMEDWDMDTNADAAPECRFVDGTKVFESKLCSHFVLSRSVSTPARAFSRALACASLFKTGCVLSPEVGLAVPAAFILRPDEVLMVVAPLLIPTRSNQTVVVRVHEPSRKFASRTVRFNTSVKVSYMNGQTRRQDTSEFFGSEAHCISLLRASFSPACWKALD
tara:strand:+ start:1603 stop:2181 length:579 start_codon:yes stop_codon:yes gene_type:complete